MYYNIAICVSKIFFIHSQFTNPLSSTLLFSIAVLSGVAGRQVEFCQSLQKEAREALLFQRSEKEENYAELVQMHPKISPEVVGEAHSAWELQGRQQKADTLLCVDQAHSYAVRSYKIHEQ